MAQPFSRSFLRKTLNERHSDSTTYRKECKCHPVWIPKGCWKMLYDPLWLGLTRKDEVAIVSGNCTAGAFLMEDR